jgi:hypothetical protein
MEKIRLQARRFFSGVRFLLPHVPGFIWIAIESAIKSTTRYWKRSQSVVEGIADQYMHDELEEEKTTEYNLALYKTCYAIASLLYLLSWLAQSWVTVEVFRLLLSAIF